MELEITFQISTKSNLFENCLTLEDSIFDAVCKSIYENDPGAKEWLKENLINIS